MEQAWVNETQVQYNDHNSLHQIVSKALAQNGHVSVCFHRNPCFLKSKVRTTKGNTKAEERILTKMMPVLEALGFTPRSAYRKRGPDALLTDANGTHIQCEVKRRVDWAKYLNPNSPYLMLLTCASVYKIQELRDPRISRARE